MSIKKKVITSVIAVLLLIAVLAAGLIYYMRDFADAPDYGSTGTGKAGTSWQKGGTSGKAYYTDTDGREYDSFVLGATAANACPTDIWNHCYHASFYNMTTWSGDMKLAEQEAEYLLEHYVCRYLIVGMDLSCGQAWGQEEEFLAEETGPSGDSDSEAGTRKASTAGLLDSSAEEPGSSRPAAGRSRVAPVSDSFRVYAESEKKSKKKRTAIKDVLPETVDARDTIRISDLNTYRRENPVFTAFPSLNRTGMNAEAVKGTAESLARIRRICGENDVQLIVVSVPACEPYFKQFSREEVSDLYHAVAAVTDFWDFSMSSLSYDVRYFYDATHYRLSVANMMASRMADSNDLYVPDDFGRLVTKDNVDQRIEELYAAKAKSASEYTKNVPVFIYHNFSWTPTPEDSLTVSADAFEKQIAALSAAGYTGITAEEMRDYVNDGAALPERAVAITIDDGYYSNYEIAYPILKKYNMKATIFVIGAFIGSTTYKNTGLPISRRFGNEEMAEMSDSGLISIQSHTFDFHQTVECEPDPAWARTKLEKLPVETQIDFEKYLVEDCRKENEAIESATGKPVIALCYPLGVHSSRAAALVAQEGIKATFTVDSSGTNVLIKGLPQSIYDLHRVNITEAVTGSAAVSLAAKTAAGGN